MAPHRPPPRRARGRTTVSRAAVVVLLSALVLGVVPAGPAPTPSAAASRTGAALSPGLVSSPLPAGPWELPRPGPVLAHADLPAEPWRPGHRGVDLPADPGDPVRAPATGRVVFAGRVGDKPVVVVRHGELRSTFEPATALGAVGDHVDRGSPVAVVAADARSHCGRQGCLHWGVRRGDRYLDPLLLVGLAAPVVLLPRR
ncbi:MULTISPECIES: murein hydrolase activator EnvC [unclassified Isoptericola]|uniref:murein hydrolase activator EnvC family protein n=1 Tax=unclassified Isoptericola TaxID=2623355 RepID=UPI0027122FE2|nr:MULTISPECIES: M23 family metallopeptidase [unclassified Isoptericola]MDO8144568.1 M23 family metallopeptidase [Isoptericola sp. 178]MDO8148412.1 M23 family metallopeptidase [Isoptericola sp. b515]